ncbi:MAG: alpha/beta hydrolase [Saprospiraceae bacterium]|nr:alpha/beta hydrolase [Saprospiraceae bacterium]
MVSSQLFIEEVYISVLKRKRTIRILLPKAYYKFPDKRLPVMYILDGQNLFDSSTSFGRPWYIRQVMDELPYKNQCIIVGIDHGEKWRGSEYLPHHHHKFTHHGEGQHFLEFIIKELKPKIDHHLRTLPDRENTMICGSSMGGLLAFYAATRKGETFGKAGVFSPSFWLYPPVLSLHPALHTKMYIMGSRTESNAMSHTLQKAYHALKKAGYPDDKVRIVIKDKGKHNEILWGQQFGPMLKWLTE